MSIDLLTKKYLSEWSTWGLNLSAPPTLIKSFDQGKSNHNYLIQGDEHSYVLRVHTTNEVYPVDHQLEYRIQNTVSQQKLAPFIAFQSIDNSYRVSHYINGKTGAINKTLSTQQLTTLCAAVNRYQSTIKNELKNLPTTVYSDVLTRYWDIYSHASSSGITHDHEKNHLRILSLCQQLEGTVKHRVLCHHDLNAENIVALNNQQHMTFHFLDWEFASAGIASIDFAALAVELNIANATMATIAQIDLEELNIAAVIYKYLCDLYTQAINALPANS